MNVITCSRLQHPVWRDQANTAQSVFTGFNEILRLGIVDEGSSLHKMCIKSVYSSVPTVRKNVLNAQCQRILSKDVEMAD